MKWISRQIRRFMIPKVCAWHKGVKIPMNYRSAIILVWTKRKEIKVSHGICSHCLAEAEKQKGEETHQPA